MAKVNVAPVKLELNEFGAFEFTAGSVDGITVDMKEQDQKLLLVFTGTGSVIVKHGNGIQGVNDIDEYTIDGYAAIVLESGAFKNVSGEDKGKCVIVPSANTVECAVVALP